MRSIIYKYLTSLYLLSFLITGTSLATESLPLYELGIGGGAFNSPHYPGSDQRQERYLFIPVFKYRGKILKADRGGMRAEFLKSPNYKLDLSFSAAFPANSKDNKARENMPDLDWIGEIGPRLQIHFIKRKEQSLNLNLQLRGVFSTTFSEVTHRGNVFHPVLAYSKREFLFDKLSLGMRAGVIWGDEKIMDYFYEVKPEYVTTERFEFDSKAGLIENHLDISLSFRVNKHFSIFTFLQNNYYSQATNKSSPLHIKDFTQSYAIGFVWYLHQSKQTVLIE